MFSTVATIPLLGEYWQESLVLTRDTNDTLVIGWLENRSASSALMIAMLSADQNLTIWNLGQGASRIAITPLANASFGIVRSLRRVLEACVLGCDGSLSPFKTIARNEGMEGSAFSLAGGALGFSSTKMLVAHLPKDARTYIAAVTAEAWDAGAAALTNGEIVRVTTGAHDRFMHIPRYRIEGRRFASDLMPIGDFSLLLPYKIIGEMNAHPRQLVVLPLADAGFVVAWTLIPNHLGSQIQFQRFNEIGKPQGPIVTIAHSDLTAHIARASLTESVPNSVLVGWTRKQEQLSRSELVSHALETGATAVLHDTGWRPLAGGFAVVANQMGRIWTVEIDPRRLVVSRSDQALISGKIS